MEIACSLPRWLPGTRQCLSLTGPILREAAINGLQRHSCDAIDTLTGQCDRALLDQAQCGLYSLVLSLRQSQHRVGDIRPLVQKALGALGRVIAAANLSIQDRKTELLTPGTPAPATLMTVIATQLEFELQAIVEVEDGSFIYCSSGGHTLGARLTAAVLCRRATNQNGSGIGQRHRPLLHLSA